MGFSRVLGASAEVVPLFGTGNNVAAYVKVGRDTSTDAIFVAAASLDWRDKYNVFEYSFNIIVEYENCTKFCFRKAQLPCEVSREDCAHILDGICKATTALLNAAKPTSVYRITCDAYAVSDKAVHDHPGLAKHDRVSVVFERCGYWVEDRSITAAGMIQWTMKR
jgi:hypothetical protein